MSQTFQRHRLAKRLAWQQALHDVRAEPRNKLKTLAPLRAWQTRRLADGFQDFLASPRMRPAAEFFLTDLYGERDFSARDRDVARIMPLMSRLLPESLLVAATDAIELAVLSHAFDLRMAQALADRPEPLAPITVADYGKAYRTVGCPRLRRHQIELVLGVGWTLDAAVKKHGVYKLLRASRFPAKAAGLSELQGFLERGFAAFEALDGAGDFLEAIGSREREVSRRLFRADADPFRPGSSRTPGPGSARSRAR
ncbi:FFLEELY motif protein [Arenimonas sp. MALMAid1274]|uniref:FFLEELY motif protein n=1 Tax=Arenimonas sp. MALMAid1274 TaxID=3411630 RepID=UPI003BA0061E